jgi:hypothetical protein
MPQTRPPDRAGATRSAEEKFLDLLLADGDPVEGSARQRSTAANDPRRNRAGGREVIARL